MGTYVATNAGDVKVGDLMIFDEDAGEEEVMAVMQWNANTRKGRAPMIRITGQSGREIVALIGDGRVVGKMDELDLAGEDRRLRLTRVEAGYESGSGVYMITGPKNAVEEWFDRVMGEVMLHVSTVTDIDDLGGWVCAVFNAYDDGGIVT